MPAFTLSSNFEGLRSSFAIAGRSTATSTSRPDPGRNFRAQESQRRREDGTQARRHHHRVVAEGAEGQRGKGLKDSRGENQRKPKHRSAALSCLSFPLSPPLPLGSLFPRLIISSTRGGHSEGARRRQQASGMPQMPLLQGDLGPISHTAALPTPLRLCGIRPWLCTKLPASNASSLSRKNSRILTPEFCLLIQPRRKDALQSLRIPLQVNGFALPHINKTGLGSLGLFYIFDRGDMDVHGSGVL